MQVFPGQTHVLVHQYTNLFHVRYSYIRSRTCKINKSLLVRLHLNILRYSEDFGTLIISYIHQNNEDYLLAQQN